MIRTQIQIKIEEILKNYKVVDVRKNEDFLCLDDSKYGFKKDNVYTLIRENFPGTAYFILNNNREYVFGIEFYLLVNNLIPFNLAEWREKQIDSIIND
jgi:hypothetical protein